ADDIQQLQERLKSLDQQLSSQHQQLGQFLSEQGEAEVLRGSQLQQTLSANAQELLSRLEALGVQSSGGTEVLAAEIRKLGEQSLGMLAELDTRLPESFGASFQEGLDRLSGLVASLLERSNQDLGSLLSELKQVLEESRNLLIERTEVLVPALDKLGDLGSGLGELQARLIAIEQGGEQQASEAISWRDEVRGLLGQTHGLIVERGALLNSAQVQLGALTQALEGLGNRFESSLQSEHAQIQEGASRAQAEIQRLLEANRELLIDRSEVLAGAMAQLNDMRVPIVALEQRFEAFLRGQSDETSELNASLFAVQTQLVGLQAAFSEASSNAQGGSELNAIRLQIADFRDEVATRLQLDLLKEDLPAQFSELSARIESWFRRQAERSVEAEARLPDAVVGKLQNAWDGLTQSIAEVVRRGFGDSTQLFSEAKALLESSKTLIDERTDLLSLGITDVGSQLSQMDQKLGGVADRISALLGYLQRGGGEKLAALMRDAEQKGLRIEQEQRDQAEQQIRLLRDLRTELGGRLEQINAGLQTPVDLLRQGLSSSSDALRGVIASGLDSVAVQLTSQQQVASERLAKLLDDVSLTAIRIEQGQQREATVLRSDMGNLAREINSDLQHTRDALQTNLAHSLSEVREISVLQQRSLAEILSQLQEHTATLMQSLSVSLEGLDKNFLNHIEKITGGQASMRENFAELAK
ncbi:MAG: hypothetical protein EBW88_09135, partial [Betaproteobacteria bacterium]|nr:hypothetical protein [Betaproteobacteria bacterium]